MSLDAGSIKRLQKALSIVDEHGTVGPRLIDDARRLWSRSRRLIRMGLVPQDTLELDAMELACYALQLPNRRGKTLPTGKPGRSTLRERAEEGAEMLVGISGGDTDEGLLDRTTRVLHEMPHRSPVLDEAKILADALNLEDFGIVGIIAQAIQTARQGEGVNQLSKSMQKREQYGYWEARLKDGFHFEAVRQIAQARLDRARKVVEALVAELDEDSDR
ncbi:MAG TPA: hypothetical protein VH370_19815 [Humisphaera sp.]|jgi:hypothetical protein|nr:hypothetical protein [Humisphaera sp.]